MTAKHRKGKSNHKQEDDFFKSELLETEVRPGGNNLTPLLVLVLVVVIGWVAGACFFFQQHLTLTDLTDNVVGIQVKIAKLQSSHEELRLSDTKQHVSENVNSRLASLEESYALTQKQVGMALAMAEQLKTSDLPAQVLSLHTEMKSHLAEVQQATVSLEQLSQLQNMLTGKSMEFEDIRMQMEGLAALSSELSHKVEDLSLNFAEAESKMEEKIAQITTMTAAFDGQTSEVLKLKNQLDTYQAQLVGTANLRAFLESKESQVFLKDSEDERVVDQIQTPAEHLEKKEVADEEVTDNEEELTAADDGKEEKVTEAAVEETAAAETEEEEDIMAAEENQEAEANEEQEDNTDTSEEEKEPAELDEKQVEEAADHEEEEEEAAEHEEEEEEVAEHDEEEEEAAKPEEEEEEAAEHDEEEAPKPENQEEATKIEEQLEDVVKFEEEVEEATEPETEDHTPAEEEEAPTSEEIEEVPATPGEDDTEKVEDGQELYSNKESGMPLQQEEYAAADEQHSSLEQKDGEMEETATEEERNDTERKDMEEEGNDMESKELEEKGNDMEREELIAGSESKTDYEEKVQDLDSTALEEKLELETEEDKNGKIKEMTEEQELPAEEEAEEEFSFLENK